MWSMYNVCALNAQHNSGYYQLGKYKLLGKYNPVAKPFQCKLIINSRFLTTKLSSNF